jgi:hypothetical protein
MAAEAGTCSPRSAGSEIVGGGTNAVATAPPGTDAPGMAAAESWCRRTEHPGHGGHQTNPSILPGASPPIMLRPDADGAVAERQLAAKRP